MCKNKYLLLILQLCFHVISDGEMSDMGNDLLGSISFSRLPYENKIQIVKTGKPQPSFPEHNSEHKEKQTVRCFMKPLSLVNRLQSIN